MKKEHGNKGNQNAAKADKTDTMMSFRCKEEDMQEWKKQAQKEARRVTQWIIETLNKAAKHES